MRKIFVLILGVINFSANAQTCFKNEVGIGLGSFAIENYNSFAFCSNHFSDYHFTNPNSYSGNYNLSNKNISYTPAIYISKSIRKTYFINIGFQHLSFSSFCNYSKVIEEEIAYTSISNYSVNEKINRFDASINKILIQNTKGLLYGGIKLTGYFSSKSERGHMISSGCFGGFDNNNYSVIYHSKYFIPTLVIGAKVYIVKNILAQFESGYMNDFKQNYSSALFQIVSRASINFCF